MENLRDKLLNLHRIYLESNNWIMAAFYGDPDVLKINRILYECWIDAEMAGEPLDYASERELKILINKAQKYIRVNPNTVMCEWLFREDSKDGWKQNIPTAVKKTFHRRKIIYML
ncbi:MAG: hypothetical protein J7J22_03440 [Candidatus Verstraetearchaeota archaeon]|nr:hypothetical protein [Candidatus Verstraetearchaeota archaeon]